MLRTMTIPPAERYYNPSTFKPSNHMSLYGHGNVDVTSNTQINDDRAIRTTTRTDDDLSVGIKPRLDDVASPKTNARRDHVTGTNAQNNNVTSVRRNSRHDDLAERLSLMDNTVSYSVIKKHRKPSKKVDLCDREVPSTTSDWQSMSTSFCGPDSPSKLPHTSNNSNPQFSNDDTVYTKPKNANERNSRNTTVYTEPKNVQGLKSFTKCDAVHLSQYNNLSENANDLPGSGNSDFRVLSTKSDDYKYNPGYSYEHNTNTVYIDTPEAEYDSFYGTMRLDPKQTEITDESKHSEEECYINMAADTPLKQDGRNASARKSNKKWDKQTKSLRQILSDISPPVLVKHIQGDIAQYIPDKLYDKPSGVVLKVMEVRRQKLLVGRRMVWERTRQEHVVSRQTFEMPANSKGWFEVFPEDGRAVEYFDTIHGITSTKSNRFLVRTSTVGYRMTLEEGVSSWLPCEIKAGETLTAGIVYMDSKKQNAAHNVKNMFKRFWKEGKVGYKREHDMRYLQCFDKEGREIMIPLIMSGVFSPIGDPGTTNYDAVYDLNDLLLAFPLPVKTQLVQAGVKTSRCSVPKGVLKVEGSREEECALVTLNGSSETFEIPLDNEMLFYSETAKHKNITREISLAIENDEILGMSPSAKKITPENNVIVSNITLPTKMRESRKSRGAALFEKLSQRKNKKERESLKSLHERGVFSSKLSKPEITYDDFSLGFKNGESESSVLPVQEAQLDITTAPVGENNTTSCPTTTTNQPKPIREKPKTLPKPNMSLILKAANSSTKTIMQTRSLPPVPTNDVEYTNETQPRNHTLPPPVMQGVSDSTETLYEHLPGSPRLQTSKDVDLGVVCNNSKNANKIQGSTQNAVTEGKATDVTTEDIMRGRTSPSDDGYLAPSEVTYENDIAQIENPCYDSVYIQKSQKQHKNVIKATSLMTCSNPSLHTDHYTDNASSLYQRSALHKHRHKLHNQSLHHAHLKHNPRLKQNYASTTALPDFVYERSYLTDKDFISYSDSFRDQLENPPSFPRLSPRDNDRISPRDDNLPLPHDPYKSRGQETSFSHARSEPAYSHYNGGHSIIGLSDTYIRNGDDSAISMCSRGEYVVTSDYSFTSLHRDSLEEEAWNPPDDLTNLTVAEVSKCLRYIGMKDRIVIRFAREQIDGSMLCSLDNKLLMEGFAELNGLEVKKVLDFVSGWRPKK